MYSSQRNVDVDQRMKMRVIMLIKNDILTERVLELRIGVVGAIGTSGVEAPEIQPVVG
jgi:hypothetical protein